MLVLYITRILSKRVPTLPVSLRLNNAACPVTTLLTTLSTKVSRPWMWPHRASLSRSRPNHLWHRTPKANTNAKWKSQTWSCSWISRKSCIRTSLWRSRVWSRRYQWYKVVSQAMRAKLNSLWARSKMLNVFWSNLKVAVSKAPINKSMSTSKCPKPKWSAGRINPTHPAKLMALSSLHQHQPQETTLTLMRLWMPLQICSTHLATIKVNSKHRPATQATLVSRQQCSISTKYPNLITCRTCTQIFRSPNSFPKTRRINTNSRCNISSTSNLSGKWCRWCKCKVEAMTSSLLNHSRKFPSIQRVASMLLSLMARATHTAVNAHCTKWALAA